MGRDDPAVLALPEPTADAGRGDAAGPEPAREANAITSRLILLYVERVGGREAVRSVLGAAGLEDQEELLLDENYWFSWEQKIALFEATAEVLGDRQVMIHVGRVALELQVGQGLKLALRALGSPRLVYQNIVRANAKFSGSHCMDLLELGRDHARLRYRDLGGHRFHPLDCQYNRGLLACIPGLFGLPYAHIAHPACGCRGADACVYEIRWETQTDDVRFTLGTVLLGATALGATALLAPGAILAGAGGATVAAAVAAERAVRHRRSRWQSLELEVKEQSEVAERLTGSLQDLVSELRLEEVLAKVTRNARSAVAGKEFALLIDDGGVRCQSSTGVPRPARHGDAGALGRQGDRPARGARHRRRCVADSGPRPARRERRDSVRLHLRRPAGVPGAAPRAARRPCDPAPQLPSPRRGPDPVLRGSGRDRAREREAVRGPAGPRQT